MRREDVGARRRRVGSEAREADVGGRARANDRETRVQVGGRGELAEGGRSFVMTQPNL